MPDSALSSRVMEVTIRVSALSPYHSSAVLYSSQGVRVTCYPRDIVNVIETISSDHSEHG